MLPPGHSSRILCASFSPTGNLLATGSGDATARLWDLFTETPSHTLPGHKSSVLCAEWEALERKLATGGHEGHVSFWKRLDVAPLIIDEKGSNMGPEDRKASRRRAEGTFKMDHVFVLGTDTHVGETFCCLPIGVLTYAVSYQKSLGAPVGVFFEGWYRQSMGSQHAEAGIYVGWAYCECERGPMGRWRAQW